MNERTIVNMVVFREYLQAGGWLVIPLLAVIFLIWRRYLVLLFEFREALAGSEMCEYPLNARFTADPLSEDAAGWLSTLPGAIPRIVRQLLARMNAGLGFREAFDQCRKAETGHYAHAIVLLAAFVTVAPLLGLLGTVFGMIDTFDAVASRSGETADMVAAGISQALITTQIGLVAALPGTLGVAHLARLNRRLSNMVDRCESHLSLLLDHDFDDIRRNGEYK